MKRFILPLLACVLLLAQCKPSEQKVTKEEAAKFATGLEQAAVKRRPDLLTSNFILQALTDRMDKEKEIKYRDALEKGMATGLKNSELDKNMYSILGKEGSFEKVKLYEKDGMQRAIFRAFGDDGINYFDMELTKLNDRVGIADMLIYSSGENISKSMAVLANKMLEETNSRITTQTTEGFHAVKRLMAKGNYKQAKKEFDLLPVYVKNTRIGDVMNIQISSNLDNETYMKEIERFEKKYTGEPCIQLTLIDLYFLKKDYEKALYAINAVDSLINKDPFLNYYRGLLYNVKGDSDMAIEYYTKVTESNPSFAAAYAELMAHYIEKGNNEKAKTYFIKYKSMRNAKEDVINYYEGAYKFLKE